MIADILSALDRTRPWWRPLAPYLPGGARWVSAHASELPATLVHANLACSMPEVDGDCTSSVASLLNALAPPDCPVKFVNQSCLPPGVAYELFINETGLCPTRNNLHDFFNGLSWFRFPKVKTLFNQIQSQQIRRQGVGRHRGVIRDTLTLLDEGGLFLLAPDPLWDAIAKRDWRRAFVQERSLWQQAQAAMIGHALLEKCVQPYKAMTANVIRMPADANASTCDIDNIMARELQAMLTGDRLQAKPHCPLPVMGIPGWDAGNNNPGFYDDLQVFRPPRS